MGNLSLCAAVLLVAGTAVAQSHAGTGHQMTGTDTAAPGGGLLREGGQSAFAAISEVVALLDADPKTDWSKVNVDALRDHLLDMDNVTLRSRVRTTLLPLGARFDISGEGPVRDSIRRMVSSHAAMAGESPGEHVEVAKSAEGAILTVTADTPAQAQRIRALGFFGVMTEGVHHQLHHVMMAKGEMHH